MKTTSTISVSLDAKYAGKLEELAKATGSKSAAVRLLLDEHEQSRGRREIEDAYTAYFAEPSAAKQERALTQEMLGIAQWPIEAPAEARRGRGKKHSTR